MLYLLRADKMYMCIDTTRGGDQTVASMYFGRRADDHIWIYAVHGIRVAGFSDAGYSPVFYPDIGFYDTPVVDDDDAGDDQIEDTLVAGRGSALPHAIADGLAAAEPDLIAIDGIILFDLDKKFGIGQAYLIAYGRSIEAGIFVRLMDKLICSGY